MAIVTLTTSPCIDINTSVPQLIPEKKLRCIEMRKEPGGGGINVSRVLKRFGINAPAIFLAGGHTGAAFSKMLVQENIESIVIDTINDTRENFIVLESSSNHQYRFGLPGSYIFEDEWKECLHQINQLKDLEFIIASGSLAVNMPIDFFAQVARIAKINGVKMILDSSGDPLKAAIEEGVFMIKPNFGELALLLGVEKLDRKSAGDGARKLIEKGSCEVCVVSMGAQGALLVHANGIEFAVAPNVEKKSTVGAGDSMVAGLVMALHSNKNFKQALQLGVACGTATTMQPGTTLCDPEDVKRLLDLIPG